MRRPHRLSAILLCALGGAACTGTILDPGQGGPGGGGPNAQAVSWLPARIRRLSNRELDNSVAALLGTTTKASAAFAPDTRQSGYTINAEQRVDGTLGDQIAAAADALATEAVTARLASLVPCDQAAASCPRTFVETFAARAFRRPVTAVEADALMTVFTTAHSGGTFADGVQAVISATLQSPSFLYTTELGREGATPDARGLVELAPHEVASALSYFVTGGPPDAALLDAAAKDELRTPAQRETQMRRLLATPAARVQIARFVKEWLGLDMIDHLDRTGGAASFSSLRPTFVAETDAFVEEVMFRGDASLAALLGADYTMANSTLGAYYGVAAGASTSDWARASLASTPRRGLLSQASFLSVYAAVDASSPVKRGVTILRRLLCQDIPFPSGEVAMKAMMVPPKDAAKTTRERFTIHSTDPACAGCHSRIDPIGFAFEEFDQMGKYRVTENGVTVDSTGSLVGTDVDGAFRDAGELAGRLASSEQVRRCFARNALRFSTAQTSSSLEEAFLASWQALPATTQSNLIEVLVAYAKSDLFVNRKVN